MIVRCVRIFDLPWHERRELPDHPAVTVGRDYLVLEIEAVGMQEPTIRIRSDTGTPSFWPASMFEVVSSNVPSNWVAHISELGTLTLSPQPWLRRTFWEEHTAGHGEAVATYERELETIEREA